MKYLQFISDAGADDCVNWNLDKYTMSGYNETHQSTPSHYASDVALQSAGWSFRVLADYYALYNCFHSGKCFWVSGK